MGSRIAGRQSALKLVHEIPRISSWRGVRVAHHELLVEINCLELA